jgi:hypothetical protein
LRSIRYAINGIATERPIRWEAHEELIQAGLID